MIRLKKIAINLDPQKNGKALDKVQTTTNPDTGKSETTTDKLDEKTGKWSNYVLDEAALERLPQSKRDELQELIQQNNFNVDWEYLKQFFKERTTEEKPSQEPIADGFIIENEGSDNAGNIVSTRGSKQYKFNDDVLKNESPEKKAQVLRDTSQGNLSDEDFTKYFTEREIPKDEEKKDSDSSTKSSSNEKKSKEKPKRRDAGFNIKATCNGSNNIRTKKTYVIEGVGKYSSTYYLYSITRTFGTNGYEMELTFTK